MATEVSTPIPADNKATTTSSVTSNPTEGHAKLTCIACRLEFTSFDSQREHYHTDWHRYNLKRKVANLPPVTLQNFDTRLRAAQQQEEKKDTDDTKTPFFCIICNKYYNSEKALNQHNDTRKHKEKEESLKKQTDTKAIAELSENGKGKGKEIEPQPKKEEDDELEDLSDDDIELIEDSILPKEWKILLEMGITRREIKKSQKISINQCLFCSEISEDVPSSLEHMAGHGFFIPYVQYLADLDGLVRYLAQKIVFGNVCILCNGKGKRFQSCEAARAHMLDKNHCKFIYDDCEDEFEEYFDFTELTEQPTAFASNGFELVLTDGTRIGNRALVQYYKQKPKPMETRASVLINRLMHQYQQLGWITNKRDHTSQMTLKEVRQNLKSNQQLGSKANRLYRYTRTFVSDSGYSA